MITIYGSTKNRAMRCVWTAEEAGVPYRIQAVDLSTREHHSAEFRAINPFGKVPAMDHNGLKLFESAAICQYIAHQNPSAGLIYEVTHPKHALIQQWCAFTISELEQPLWLAGKHRFALPAEYRVAGIRETAEYEFRLAAQVVADQLFDQPFMLGSDFTVVDILVGQTLMWAQVHNFAPLDQRLQDYVTSLKARSAFQRIRAKAAQHRK